MRTLTEILKDAGYANRIISDKQLKRLLGGGEASRYGLVNRASKVGELIRIKRGYYVLAERYRDYRAHPFRIAQSLYPGSYISFETALAHHGWIPEAVYATASVIPGRKSKEVTHPQLGHFSFHPLALHELRFLELVDRVQIEQQTMLIAQPHRALLDLVCIRKAPWRGINWLESGMRIDRASLKTITKKDFLTLRSIYKHKSVRGFIDELQEALNMPAPVETKRETK